MAYCGKRRDNKENSEPNKTSKKTKVCKMQNKHKPWNKASQATKLLHYSSWILDRDFSVYSQLGQVSHVLHELQKLFQCPCNCEDSRLLQMELDLLLLWNGLPLLVEEVTKSPIQNSPTWSSFVIGDLQLTKKQGKGSDRQTRQQLLHEWRKECTTTSGTNPFVTNQFLFRNRYRKSLYLSPCLNLDWNLITEAQRSGFLPYNLKTIPIPTRDPSFHSVALAQQQEDESNHFIQNIQNIRQKKVQTEVQTEAEVDLMDNLKGKNLKGKEKWNKEDELWVLLTFTLVLPTDLLHLTWMYVVSSTLVREVEEKTWNWSQSLMPRVFYPHYTMIKSVNHLNGSSSGKLRHIDVHKVNDPIDVVNQIGHIQTTDLFMRRKEHAARSPPYTFVLDITVAVPILAVTSYNSFEWPVNLTLEEWILWSMIREIAKRKLYDCMFGANAIAFQHSSEFYDKLMLFRMDKEDSNFLKTCLDVEQIIISYLQELPPYEIQHVDETHASHLLPKVCERMKQWRTFPTSPIYECKFSEWLLPPIRVISWDLEPSCLDSFATVLFPKK